MIAARFVLRLAFCRKRPADDASILAGSRIDGGSLADLRLGPALCLFAQQAIRPSVEAPSAHRRSPGRHPA